MEEKKLVGAGDWSSGDESDDAAAVDEEIARITGGMRRCLCGSLASREYACVHCGRSPEKLVTSTAHHCLACEAEASYQLDTKAKAAVHTAAVDSVNLTRNLARFEETRMCPGCGGPSENRIQRFAHHGKYLLVCEPCWEAYKGEPFRVSQHTTGLAVTFAACREVSNEEAYDHVGILDLQWSVHYAAMARREAAVHVAASGIVGPIHVLAPFGELSPSLDNVMRSRDDMARALFETDARVLQIVRQVCGPHSREGDGGEVPIGDHEELTVEEVVDRAWAREEDIVKECRQRAWTMLNVLRRLGAPPSPRLPPYAG